MKSFVGLILSVLICCCGFAAAQQPLKGKFVIKPQTEYEKTPGEYIIIKENFRFTYSPWGSGEYYNGHWEYIDDSTIKISFDEPKRLGDILASPRPTAYIVDTIKIGSRDVLLIKKKSLRYIQEREFIRIPEE